MVIKNVFNILDDMEVFLPIQKDFLQHYGKCFYVMFFLKKLYTDGTQFFFLKILLLGKNEKGKGGQGRGDGRRLDFRSELTIEYTDVIL